MFNTIRTAALSALVGLGAFAAIPAHADSLYLGFGDRHDPRFGIYAVTGRIVDGGTALIGAANLGIRPQFEPPVELLEPFFFDFSGDLYGQEIEVSFHHFIRPEAKFDSLDALVAQMARDCDEARKLLSAAAP